MTHQKQYSLVCGLLALSAALGGLSTSANAATFYVSKASTASDSVLPSIAKDNSAKPFLTIQKAVDQAKDNPGLGVNEIIVEPGTYDKKVVIRLNGLTLKARNDARYSSSRSILKPPGPDVWNIVSIEASNVTLRGFEIDGSLAYVDGRANSEEGNVGAATSGVSILGEHLQYGTTITIPAARYVKVVTCIVHDCGGGGIGGDGLSKAHSTDYSLNTAPVGGPDYITIEDNEVYNNCFWSRYVSSAVSLHNMTNSNTADTGVHNIISRNKIYGNTAKYTKADAEGNLDHTDGNGIILDFNTNKNPNTLIENNLVFNNGGRGIYMLNSSNVTVRNNSTYNNNVDPDISGGSSSGELVAISSKNILFANNVSSSSAPNFRAEKKYGFNILSNIIFRACTYFGGTPVIDWSGVTWTDTFHGDPYYASPSTGNLYPNVAPGTQTVIDRASNISGDYAAADYYTTQRPQGAARDRGAIERSLPALRTSVGTG